MTEILLTLNNIQPAPGSKHAKRRVGRGIGCGLGKTCGRGHKGQKSRAGGFHKVGFEGGQMPLYRRLPKRGFINRSKQFTAEIFLSDLEKLAVEEVNLAILKQAGLVGNLIQSVKVVSSGTITRKVVLQGIRATAQAAQAITSAGGSITA